MLGQPWRSPESGRAGEARRVSKEACACGVELGIAAVTFTSEWLGRPRRSLQPGRADEVWNVSKGVRARSGDEAIAAVTAAGAPRATATANSACVCYQSLYKAVAVL